MRPPAAPAARAWPRRRRTRAGTAAGSPHQQHLVRRTVRLGPGRSAASASPAKRGSPASRARSSSRRRPRRRARIAGLRRPVAAPATILGAVCRCGGQDLDRPRVVARDNRRRGSRGKSARAGRTQGRAAAMHRIMAFISRTGSVSSGCGSRSALTSTGSSSSAVGAGASRGDVEEAACGAATAPAIAAVAVAGGGGTSSCRRRRRGGIRPHTEPRGMPSSWHSPYGAPGIGVLRYGKPGSSGTTAWSTRVVQLERRWRRAARPPACRPRRSRAHWRRRWPRTGRPSPRRARCRRRRPSGGGRSG